LEVVTPTENFSVLKEAGVVSGLFSFLTRKISPFRNPVLQNASAGHAPDGWLIQPPARELEAAYSFAKFLSPLPKRLKSGLRFEFALVPGCLRTGTIARRPSCGGTAFFAGSHQRYVHAARRFYVKHG